jgi:alkylation response protein AidB-like acyl-CoA dehydrogenase
LDHVLRTALGVTDGGEPAIVLPVLGRTALPGRVDGAALAVSGVGTAALRRSETALVVAAAGDGRHVLVATDALVRREVGGLDPDLGLVEVSGEAVPVTSSSLAPEVWDGAVAAGQRALAHELVGVSRTMLALAREHALERIQFGQPIAGFQAVRHRLAESLVAVEAADAAVAGAWDDGSVLAAALAKAVAGRGARTVARHAQQVLAGIGFTAEHPFHRHLRRTLALDQLLGSSAWLTRQLGEQLLQTRRLPPLLPL